MRPISKIIILVLLFSLFHETVVSQTQMKENTPTQIMEKHFRIFKPDGKEATLDELFAAMKNVDVVFVGESHDDPVAHYMELAILRAANERYGKTRPVVLALEMIERDVQVVVDEYLAGLITETHFTASSRAWKNYQQDYRPMVEYAKENKLAVIAANAPRRYINRVSRLGRASLNELSPQAKQWLAPLPYAEASKAYTDKFVNLMNQSGMSSTAHQITKDSPVLASQSLWDATMAFSIAEVFKTKPNALVVQVNGSFHSEEKMGIPDHLLNYRKGTKMLVVTVKPDSSFPSFDVTKLGRLGDFVILADPSLPRSY